MLITAKMNRDFKACYSDDRLAELYGDGKTPEQVATLRDGLWADVSDTDRCWILWRVIATKNKAGMRECLARMLERVLPDGCDPRSRAVVEAIRQDAVTDEIIAAACAAEASARADAADADAAAAAAAAYEAARASYAARAVYEASCAARAAYEASAAYAWARAWAHAWDEVSANAERRSQISDILEFCV